MQDSNITPIQIERAMEQLRQEQVVFEQRKAQESKWFNLRLTMGYVSVVLLLAIIVISTLVLFNSSRFPKWVINTAGAALFGDLVALLIGVWKIVLKPNYITELTPETKQELPGIDTNRK